MNSESVHFLRVGIIDIEKDERRRNFVTVGFDRMYPRKPECDYITKRFYLTEHAAKYFKRFCELVGIKNFDDFNTDALTGKIVSGELIYHNNPVHCFTSPENLRRREFLVSVSHICSEDGFTYPGEVVYLLENGEPCYTNKELSGLFVKG